MNASLSPQSIRALLPIYIDVWGIDVSEIDVSGGSSAKIQIVPTDARSTLSPFSVEPVVFGDRLRATFWLEHPGPYEARVSSGTEVVTLPFQVREQTFLTFPIEFGIFMAILTVAAGGLILWHKRKKP